MFGKRRKQDNKLTLIDDETERVLFVEKRKKIRKKRFRQLRLKPEEILEYAGELSVIILIAGILIFSLVLYLHNSRLRKVADNAVPQMIELEDGSYDLSWPEYGNADLYCVQISTYVLSGKSKGKIVYKEYFDENHCILPQIPADEMYTLQINPIKNYKLFGDEGQRVVKAPIVRYFHIQNSTIEDLIWKINSEEQTVTVNIDSLKSNCFGLFVTQPDGSKKFLKSVDENNFVLDFKGKEELPTPEPDNPCNITCLPGISVKGMTIYSKEAREMSISWAIFTGVDIHLSASVKNDSIAHLEWEHIGGDVYEVEMKENNGSWETVKKAEKGTEYTYSSPRLKPGVNYEFRVKTTIGSSDVISEVCECKMGVTPMYSTIWPVKSLDAYVFNEEGKKEKIGQAKAETAYCVVDVRENMFGIRLEDRIGYIDSNYCMINLSEYLGDLCSYDITNSYCSIFTAHGIEIPELTGEVVPGFESVMMVDDSFLVPLLYPTALKLRDATEIASQQGYKLKIYEAFRPHDASTAMYKRTEAVKDAPLGEIFFFGEDAKTVYYEPGFSFDTRGENGFSRRMTYWELMNGNNSFTLSSFVSAGISRHNIGVALDLTLEDLYTGEEIRMQTPIHDLSQYSALKRNIRTSNELANIMKSAGFKDLFSEWWHFQDDQSKNSLALPCINRGVSPSCWMENGYGRRYRNDAGVYLTDCEYIIDGKTYEFDEDGYIRK